MATQLLFYSDAVPVSQHTHGDTSIKMGANYGFARNVNSVPVTAAEFSASAHHYPIVFAGTDEVVMPTVILGTRDNENMFVDGDGKWTAGYVPAFVRRYPFVFSTEDDGKQLVLHIDSSFEGVNTDGRGERLFDSDGEQTQYLKNVLAFLQGFQTQFQRTQTFCDRLMSLKLLKPMQAQFNLADGEQRLLAGFYAVDREALKALDAETVQQMFAQDELECIYVHLQSLRHFNDMVGRAAIPTSDPAPETMRDPAPEPEPATES